MDSFVLYNWICWVNLWHSLYKCDITCGSNKAHSEVIWDYLSCIHSSHRALELIWAETNYIKMIPIASKLLPSLSLCCCFLQTAFILRKFVLIQVKGGPINLIIGFIQIYALKFSKICAGPGITAQETFWLMFIKFPLSWEDPDINKIKIKSCLRLVVQARWCSPGLALPSDEVLTYFSIKAENFSLRKIDKK